MVPKARTTIAADAIRSDLLTGYPARVGVQSLVAREVRPVSYRTSAMTLEMAFGVVIPVAGPVIPIGAVPSLDPFPPKLPV